MPPQIKSADIVNEVFQAIKNATYGKLSGEDRARVSADLHKFLAPSKMYVMMYMDKYFKALTAAEEAQAKLCAPTVPKKDVPGQL